MIVHEMSRCFFIRGVVLVLVKSYGRSVVTREVSCVNLEFLVEDLDL